MISASDQQIAELLYQVLQTPIGLLISTNDPVRAKSKLYALRAKLADPELKRVQIRASPWPDQGQLVLIKGPAQA